MVNWKNLRNNPPIENCDVCLKIGDNYETFKFCLYSNDLYGWGLKKASRSYSPNVFPEDTLYIILNNIL